MNEQIQPDPHDPQVQMGWAAQRGIEDAIRRSTVGIVYTANDEIFTAIATGTLIHARGRHFILTAHHVVRETRPADLRFFFPLEDAPIDVERSTLMSMPINRIKRHTFSQPPLGKIIFNEDLDVALIPVPSSAVAGHPAARFFEMSRGASRPADGTDVVMMGYPIDISRSLGGGSQAAFSQKVWTKVEPDRADLRWAEYDPQKNFLAAYTAREVDPDANPGGMSGAGVWAHEPAPVVWHPNLEMVGMVLAYKHGLLRIIRRDEIDWFISERASGGSR